MLYHTQPVKITLHYAYTHSSQGQQSNEFLLITIYMTSPELNAMKNSNVQDMNAILKKISISLMK